MKAISIILMIACALTAGARTAADFFAQAPAAVLPLLAPNTRLDMIDYFNSNLQTPSVNTLGGRSRITELSPEAVTVELSRGATMQLAVIPAGRDSIVAVIETVLTPAADSNIRLYPASDWSEMASPAMPGVAQFADPAHRKEIRTAEMPAYLFVRAEYKPDTGLFRFTDTTRAYYTSDDIPAGLALMRSNIDMRLSGGKFTEAK